MALLSCCHQFKDQDESSNGDRPAVDSLGVLVVRSQDIVCRLQAQMNEVEVVERLTVSGGRVMLEKSI